MYRFLQVKLPLLTPHIQLRAHNQPSSSLPESGSRLPPSALVSVGDSVHEEVALTIYRGTEYINLNANSEQPYSELDRRIT
jgi:hypothetical protein